MPQNRPRPRTSPIEGCFAASAVSSRPSSALANALKGELMKRDVYVFCRWNMLFVAPPLIVDEDELRIGVKAIDEALDLADRYATTGNLA